MALAMVQTARADVFAILPPFTQGQDGVKVGLQIARIIQADLEGQNSKVLPPESTVSYVPKDQRVVCENDACVEHYRATAMATAAINIRVYRAQDGAGPATSFQLGIQPKLGVEYLRGEILGKEPLEDVVRKVFRDVLGAYRNPGPWLQVLGTKGADVYLDERRVGVIPWTDRVPLGMHQLRVEAAGFEPQSRLVPLSAPGASVEERFTLEPAKAHAGDGISARASADESLRVTMRERASIGLLAAGAPALVAGALWLGLGLRDRAHDGECLDKAVEFGVCRVERDVNWKPAVYAGSALTVLGASSLIAGALLYRTERRGLSVNVGSASVSVRGEF